MQAWSVKNLNYSGWFYGSDYYPYMSSADVSVFRDLTDPTTVTHAEQFSYTGSQDWAADGDCILSGHERILRGMED